MTPQPPTFQLSNGTDKPPIVHVILEPSTSSWQYVVADPSTRRCVIIDATRDYREDEISLSTSAADSILNLVHQHEYTVQHILETNSAVGSKYRSASWYLRMQLAQLQGWPPEISSDATLAFMSSMWEKRHGIKVTTSLHEGLDDGETFMIGRMRVRCIHLPSYATPQRRAFVIGNNIFGSHSLATLSRQSHLLSASTQGTTMDQDTAEATWRSMRRILSFPGDTRLYLDLADAPTSQTTSPAFHSVQACRELNEYIDLTASDFLTRWQGQQQENTVYGQKHSRKLPHIRIRSSKNSNPMRVVTQA